MDDFWRYELLSEKTESMDAECPYSSIENKIPLQVTVRRAYGLPFSLVLHRPPEAYVEIAVEGQPCSGRTQVAQPNTSPVWDGENHVVLIPNIDTHISFAVHRFISLTVPGRETFLGNATAPVRDLVNRGEPIILTLDHDTTGASGVLEVEAFEITLEEAFDMVTSRAGERLVPSTSLVQLFHANKPVKDSFSALSDVLSALRTIKNVGNMATKIHPLVNVAWKVFSLASVIYESQLQQDHNLIHLLLTMSQVYPYVGQVADAGVAHIKRFRDDIASLLHLSTEYIEVVATYVTQPTFTRFVRPVPNFDKYKQRFEELKEAFELGAKAQILLHVGNTAKAVLDLESQIVLARLKPSYTRQAATNGCQKRTRDKTIDTIMRWALSRDHDKKILWLHGPPGSGKSAIAATIADEICRKGRLGAAHFFDRNSTDKGEVAKCLESLTYQLSQFSPRYGKTVAQTMRDNPGIVHTALATRFRELLIQPSTVLSDSSAPTIIIVDGLDECGDVLTRKELMSVIEKELPYMPQHVRVLITSRPEHDIRRRFVSSPYVEVVELDVKDGDNIADIREFLCERLEEIREESQIPSEWPSEDHLDALVERSSGVFRWAVLAIEVIGCTGDPQRRIEELISDNYTDAQVMVDWHVFGLQDRGHP